MIFQLKQDDISFPPAELAEEDGLLAIGADLSPVRLINAYKLGIFPWYSEETPILWYSPHERCVIFPERVKVSKSMRKVLNSGRFTITWNKAFKDVILNAATIYREGQSGTWITDEMREAYCRLYELGYAQSVEIWEDGNLVGGLYGVAVGTVFCGESMFSKVADASKAALIYLCRSGKFKMIDCQIHNDHLERMGAEIISRRKYMEILKEDDKH